MGKLSVSAVVITKNESANIQNCIRSISCADEVIVVDSGSADNTAAIARSLGARVFVKTWAGYAAQKNYAVSKARGRWILCVDADETIPLELNLEIKGIAAGESAACGYYIPRRNYFYGRLMKHGGLYPDGQVRLFKKGKASFTPILLHETLKVNGETGWLKNPMLHFTKNTITEHMVSANKYTGLETEQRLKNGYVPTGYSVMIKPVIRFLRFYFLKAGFMDGFQGLIYHVITAFMMFVSEVKILEARGFKDSLFLTLFKRAR